MPVAPIALGPLAFVVHPDVPAATMREFVDYARRNPGKLNYGSAGAGSVNHLALEFFMARTGTLVRTFPTAASPTPRRTSSAASSRR